MSSYLDLEGKRALVTGGTKGVGQAVVAALREAGATVRIPLVGGARLLSGLSAWGAEAPEGEKFPGLDHGGSCRAALIAHLLPNDRCADERPPGTRPGTFSLAIKKIQLANHMTGRELPA